jgi:hypothetical protein
MFMRMKDEFQQFGKELRHVALANDRGYFYVWVGRDFAFRRDFPGAVEAFRRAQDEFRVAGYPLNSVWAALQEARIYLHQCDVVSYERIMSEIRRAMEVNAPPVIQFELDVVDLGARYALRADSGATLELAKERLASMSPNGDMMLRIELVQTSFRLFARAGNSGDAEGVFEIYRELVSEVLANVEPGKAAVVAEWFSLGDIMSEHSKLLRQNENEGPTGALA